VLVPGPACYRLPGAAPRSPLGRFGHRELPGQVKADKATEAGKPRRIQVSASHPVRRTKIRYSIHMLTSLQSCQLSDHHDGNTPRSTGYAPFWNPIDISPEMRANYLSLQPRKSMVAGVDIGRLHGYSFSRSPERQ